MRLPRRALKCVLHPLMVLFVAAALLAPIQLANVAPAQAAATPIQVTVGQSHACALNYGGRAQCWGNNDNGHLGNGATLSSAMPVNVNQGSVAFVSIGAGTAHTCALTAAGQTYCWGWGTYGQLGNGSTGNATSPVAVTQSGVTYTSIAIGGNHTCGLDSGGQAYCWGYNANSQLGNGGTTNATTPVAVTQGAVTFASLTAGSSHMCGLTSGGLAYCWGYGSYGALGVGVGSGKTTPYPVTQGAVLYASIAAGLSHTCALTSGGQAYCWGTASSGQVGYGGTTQQNAPVPVSQTGLTFTSLTTSGANTCGLVSGGQMYCWGLNSNGQIGDNTTTNRLTPTAVTQSGTTFANMSVGPMANANCGVAATTGRVYCWGERAGSVLGDGTSAGQATRSLPVLQASLSFSQIGVGQNHTCALASGQTYCWGQGSNSQIGNGSTSDQAVPTAVTQGGNTYTQIAVGALHTCGLTAAGQTYCWGYGGNGRLGNGGSTDQATPVAVTQSGVTYTSIYSGWGNTCGLTSGGQAYCWGYGTYGELGNGSSSASTTPVAVTQGAVTFTSLSAGTYHVCGLTSGGQTYCWGYNSSGQLGDGSGSNQSTPVAVTQGAVTFVSISSGSVHVCGLTSAGQTYCWGAGANQRLGNGSSSNQPAPTAVTQSSVIYTSVSASLINGCGLSSTGGAYCWGGDVYGQDGDGATVSARVTPVAVSQGPRFSYLAQGAYASHMCALDNGGRAYCWGYDLVGQLGAYGDALLPSLTLYVVDSEGASASTTIDPSFFFGAAGRATACNGSSTPTGTATSSSIDLGHLTAATPVLGAQDFTAATNAAGGFSVAVKFSGPLMSTTGAAFTNAPGSAGTPAAFGSGERFGYTTSASAGFSGPLWAGPTTSYATLYTNPGAASVSNCIAYQAAAGSLTPAGAYSVTVIYLAVPTF